MFLFLALRSFGTTNLYHSGVVLDQERSSIRESGLKSGKKVVRVLVKWNQRMATLLNDNLRNGKTVLDTVRIRVVAKFVCKTVLVFYREKTQKVSQNRAPDEYEFVRSNVPGVVADGLRKLIWITVEVRLRPASVPRSKFNTLVESCSEEIHYKYIAK